MKPIFKYSGSKLRESKFISTLLPDNILRVVEPFAGSAALGWSLEKPMLLCDTRKNNMAVYRCVKDPNSYQELQHGVDWLSTLDVEELKQIYYEQRDDMWQKCDTDLQLAKRWIVIRQLVFSGMDRINTKTHKFNAPFGGYTKFKCNLNIEHHQLLQSSVLLEDDFESIVDNLTDDDFIFLDPPYYNRNSTYSGDYDDSEQLHLRIKSMLSDIKNNGMIVHVDCELYRNLYCDHHIQEKNFNYSSNFKGRNNEKSKVKHLYITNY